MTSTATSQQQASGSTPTAATSSSSSSPAHSLHTHWSLYYDSKKTQKPGQAWLDSLVHAHTVGSVEEFWAMVCTVKKPSQIELQSHPNPNYHFFRKGIKPQWEDEANKEGGRFMINLVREDDLKNMDFFWEETLMALVGEYLDDDDLITGAVFSKRRGLFRISIWTKHTEKTAPEGALLKMAKKLRHTLGLKEVAAGSEGAAAAEGGADASEGVAIEFYPHAGDNKVPTLKA